MAIVTGAAGGVGSAVVRLLTAEGYRVVATDISPKVTGLPGEIDGGEASILPLVADVSLTESAEAAVAQAVERFGRLDLLVNNAARFIRKPITQSTDEDFDRLIAINAKGPFVHARAAVPALLEARGNIVNIASTSGLIGVANQSIYAMTKGAIVQLTRQLAIELAPAQVRVNAVAPGAIDTDFIAEARAADPDPEATARISLARHPLGRISTPQDVAEAVVFLASPRASGITGTIFSVDGGYLAQ